MVVCHSIVEYIDCPTIINPAIQSFTIYKNSKAVCIDTTYTSHPFFLGKLPSPPRQLGLAPTSSPLSAHFSGVKATILKAWTGPSNSSFNTLFTRRCLAMGVFPWKDGEMTITLKCVSEFAGLFVNGMVRLG